MSLEEIREALLTIRQQIEQCREFFDEILIVDSPFKTVETSSEVKMNIEDAVKKVNEMLEHCRKLMKSLSSVKLQAKMYHRVIRELRPEEILNMLIAEARRAQLRTLVPYLTRRVTEVKQKPKVIEVKEVPHEVIEEINKKFEKGEYIG